MKNASTTTIGFQFEAAAAPGRPKRPARRRQGIGEATRRARSLGASNYFQSAQRDSALVVYTSSPFSFCTTL